MNIIYVHSGELPSNSPSITFTSNTVKSLAGVTDKCFFYVKRNSKLSPEEIFKTNLKMKKPDNLEIRAISVFLGNKYNSVYYWQVFKDILRIAKINNIDAIITRNVTFLPKLIMLKNKFNCKIYLETHDFFTDLTLRTDINITKKHKQQSLEKKYIPKLDGILCLTNTQINLYSKYYPCTKLFLARTGLNILSASPIKQRKYLGYVGSLDIHKGVMNLIKIASLTKSHPEIIIIGAKSKEEKDLFLKKVESIYDTSKLKVYMWQDKETLNTLLDEVKIGFVTLTDTFFNKYLTSPLKIFDYFSKLIPVIGSKLPTIEEVIFDNNNGFLYEAGKEKELAIKIDELMFDDTLYSNFQVNIASQLPKLTWDERARRIIKAFESS